MKVNAAEAKDYIFALITTAKLTEKEIRSLENEAAKWRKRVELARSKGENELLEQAEKETEKIETRLLELKKEECTLKDDISAMKRKLPGIEARERSIDPDLLEQELLMTLDNLNAITKRPELPAEQRSCVASAMRGSPPDDQKDFP